VERTPEQIARDRRALQRLLLIAFVADLALAAVLLAVGQDLGALALAAAGVILTPLALYGVGKAREH
jgi:hypothetical protein